MTFVLEKGKIVVDEILGIRCSGTLITTDVSKVRSE